MLRLFRGGTPPFAAGLKGRYRETRYEDHLALEGMREVPVVEDGRLQTMEVSLRNAMNEQLRDDYVEDCLKGVRKWNKVMEKAGLSFRFSLPSTRFNRGIGVYADHSFDLEGNLISDDEFQANLETWMPSTSDENYVKSLMKPVYEPGKMAGWIAPPRKGINGNPLDYEYVRTDY